MMHDVVDYGAQSRSEEKSQFSEDDQHRDGGARKKPKDRHPHGGQEYPEPDSDDQCRKDRGHHRASERADQITSNESGDQSIDTRNKEECERENHHPNSPSDYAGMVIGKRRLFC